MKQNNDSEQKSKLGKHHTALKVRAELIRHDSAFPYGITVMFLGGFFLLGGILFSSLTLFGLLKAATDKEFTPSLQPLMVGSVLFAIGLSLLWGGYRWHRHLKRSKEELEKKLKEEYGIDENMKI